MGIRDQRIDWIRKRLWIPPFAMQGIGMHAAADVVLHSLETIAAEYSEITNVGMGGVTLTDGEFINGYIRCPIDLDPSFPVGFRIAYTIDHDGTGDATVSWILLQNAIAEGIAIALPATALNTIIPLLDKYTDDSGVSVVTDFLLQMTDRGIRNSIGLTRAQIEQCAFLTLKVEMDAAIEETSVRYIGLEMDYVPMKTQGEGSHTDKPLQTDGIA